MISVITPVWNHCADLTRPFVEGLMEKTKGVEFELIIVNNGSLDNTAEYLESAKKQYKNLKVINSPANLGFGGGNNLGYKEASGEYICFLSNDVVITNPTWLKSFYTVASNNPKTLLGPELVTWNDLTRFKGEMTPYIVGYCMFGTKKMFDEILDEGQVFDENFGKAYFEDVELSYRAKQAGYELIQVPDVGLHHLVSKSSDQMDISKQTLQAQAHFTNKMSYHFLQKNGKKRIVFFFNSTYPFIDDDYEGKGVGGAEASLILLARAFAKAGWQTEIYNTTQKTGKFNGVEYHNISEFRKGDFCDVFVLFRVPDRILPYVNAVTKVFWSCDQYTTGNWKTQVFPYVDKVVCISQYHANYMDMVYGPIKDKLEVLELGVNIEDYDKEVKKEPNKLIFCSVPRRGLEHMARLLPMIQEEVKDAKLYITSDYTLWGLDHPDNQEFRDMLSVREGVTFLGKVSRKELVEHQMSAEVMAYSCTYEECFCIAAMECIAAGAIPVTTSLAALKTTVGESGILLSNFPGTTEYDKLFVSSVVKLLTNKKYADELRIKGRERAKQYYSWEKVCQNWINMATKIEKKLTAKAPKVGLPCDGEGCEVVCINSYVLARHKAKAHGDSIPTPEGLAPGDGIVPVQAPQKPETQLLRFKRKIEVNINGKRYEGTEIDVDFDMVPAVIDTAIAGYGHDILEV